ncbi:hypothetical protein BD309DRAFT_966135 [Dichomitus squalens]|nr:hypothetical protein BD309DRAFT_966135 [Dichomitus squalens]
MRHAIVLSSPKPPPLSKVRAPSRPSLHTRTPPTYMTAFFPCLVLAVQRCAGLPYPVTPYYILPGRRLVRRAYLDAPHLSCP